MVPFNHYSFIYLIGIGGIGMSALARLFAKQGYQVFGYDQSLSSLVVALKREGIVVSCDDCLSAVPEVVVNHPDQTLVIYTPAIPTDNAILSYFKTAGYTIQSRAEILGLISRQFTTIAVAGTHGKTSTAAMIAHILYQSHHPMVAFVGGIIDRYDSNLLSNCSLNAVKLMVAEADEFNKSFLHLRPAFSIVTAADADHPDTYRTPALMQAGFIEFIENNQSKLLIQYNAANELGLYKNYTQPFRTYGLDQGDIVASNVVIGLYQSSFDYLGCGIRIANLVLPIAGLHNIENALAAITICLELGISQTALHHAMATFPGIKRRFSIVSNDKRCLLIDDYAHHPVEIRALLTSVKTLYPSSVITAIFQPHLFSRTQAFSTLFATTLSLADQVFILPIYPAREEPIPGVTAELIFDALTCKQKALVTMDDLLTKLVAACSTIREHQVILTIGAGDIGEMVLSIAETITASSRNW